MAKHRLPNLEVANRRGEQQIYYRVGKGPRIRLPGPLYSDEFYKAYELAKANCPAEIARIEPPTSAKQTEEQAIARLLTALKTCRNRAAKRGWAYDLDEEWLLAKLAEQEFRCSLTGIRFLSKFDRKTKVHPFTPSIDRIIPGLGYTKENTRIVVFAINAMMMDWGENLFAQVAKSYRSKGIKTRSLRPRIYVPSPITNPNLTKTTA